jgi:recombinational DNA repair protein (RecF pathway)
MLYYCSHCQVVADESGIWPYQDGFLCERCLGRVLNGDATWRCYSMGHLMDFNQLLTQELHKLCQSPDRPVSPDELELDDLLQEIDALRH